MLKNQLAALSELAGYVTTSTTNKWGFSAGSAVKNLSSVPEMWV